MTELTKRNGVTIRHRERLPSKRKVKKIIRDVSAALAALSPMLTISPLLRAAAHSHESAKPIVPAGKLRLR